MLQSRLAQLHELDSLYSLQDLWDLYEVHAVARHNEQQAIERASKQRK